jgi:hypothetical protein
MEGHARMDMSVGGDHGFWRRLASSDGYTAVANYFVMDWAAIWRDIVVGLLDRKYCGTRAALRITRPG